jgi:crotonobetainyl-CoA:carnitine CoA-transferase CaiB-like acyl-CoA transferase
MSADTPTGPLAGLKVLDLSRVLAGPWSTQILGDLGAEIFKIEQPGQGDDTRRWGPPFLQDGSRDSAYYLCANRNKHSIAIDLAQPEGAALIRKLAEQCDIVVENFRVGGLKKYGLDYESLSAINPKLVYCSITGFGQEGPYKDRGGYDFLIQGMSGLMSVTGRPDDEPGGGPMKVGIPISDLVTGLYATISILAAVHHRDVTGQGQHIDCALLDTQVSLLANQASNYLNGGWPTSTRTPCPTRTSPAPTGRCWWRWATTGSSAPSAS